jgi:hypothetical protein
MAFLVAMTDDEFQVETIAPARARAMAKTAARTKKPSTVPSDLMPDFKRVKAAAKATKLPAIEEATSYGTPSMKVKGKFLLRMREPDILVLTCSLEEKEFLMQNAPKIYFETDHYKGWPAVLIRLSKIKDDELVHRIAVAWALQAPKKLLAEVRGKEK